MATLYDLIVIGGGSAGLVAAGGAGLLGAKVVLVERDRLGGDCLYTGCVPSKSLIRSARFAHEARSSRKFGFEPVEPQFSDGSFASITKRVQRVIGEIEKRDSPEVFEKMGVEVVFGEPKFTGPREIEVSRRETSEKLRLRGRRFCISTGSRPTVPPVEGLDDVGFITNEDVFHLEVLPERLLVLGGGPIGIELGQAFSRFGSRVTVVEAGDRILAKEDEDVSAFMERLLRSEGLEILTRTNAIRAEVAKGAKIVTVASEAGEESAIEADEILVATGRRPNVDTLDLERAGVRFDDERIVTDGLLRTSRKHIFAAGDVTGNYPFTHMADQEARIVLQNVFAPWPFRKKADHTAVPWATFSDPEVGRVGMTETEAREKWGESVSVWRADLDENDRAHANEQTKGFLKLIARNDRIVGATIIAEHAGEMIHDLVWAMHQGLRVADLNKIIRVYPTLSKLLQEAGTQATLSSLKSPLTERLVSAYLRVWRRLIRG